MSAALAAAPARLERVLGRPEYRIPTEDALARLAGERVLVTGSAGSIGAATLPVLLRAGVRVYGTDLIQGEGSLDVRDQGAVERWVRACDPTLILHLAGAKHAPQGEQDPAGVCATNAIGTMNVLASGRRVVLASTCKAASPETAYGASKLLAERMTLSAGGSVARFYNVVETSGNVFQTWAAVAPERPLEVTPCSRLFISLHEAVALLLWTAVLPAGRYAISPVVRRAMSDVAADLYPGRELAEIPARRGDRLDEPIRAPHERLRGGQSASYIARIESDHER